MLSNILDRISFWALFAVVTLLPIFFLPFTNIPIETSKGLLLVIGLAVSIIFWAAARFSDGKIILPKSWILVSGFGIVLAFLVSAIFSLAMKVSFFGSMLDTGSFYFILAAFLLMLVSAVTLRDVKNTKMVFLGLIASSGLLFVFTLAHLFIPQKLSLGVLGMNTDNILGSWNTLGVFAGLGVIISLFVFEFFNLVSQFKILLGVFMVLALFLATAVNFPIVWGVLGIFSLFIFVYKVALSGKARTEGQMRSFPVVSFSVIILSIMFFMSANFIGGYLPARLGISNMEVKPVFLATLSVAKDVLIKNPILGAGPNRFPEVWAMHKPAVVNITEFWDAYFDSGMGLLPTFASTTGGLGIIMWLIFLALLVMFGVKVLFHSKENNGSKTMAGLFFVISFYLFVMSFFYSLGMAVFLLAFVFAGAFIGLSTSGKEETNITFSFLDDPRKSFLSILVLVFIMIVCIATSFKFIERFASVAYFQKTFSAQTITEAEFNINKALSLYSNDIYLRAYSQVYVSKISSLVAKGSSLSDGDKADLQADFDKAVAGMKGAIAYDNTNYLNFYTLGSLYEGVASIGVAGAYDMALDAYKRASDLNPLNPGIKLSMARVSFANNKIKDAKDYAIQVVSLKPNYINGFIVLSQIAKSEGNNSEALSYAETALSFSPQDKNLIQYVNSLKSNYYSPALNPETSNIDSSTSTKNTKKQ